MKNKKIKILSIGIVLIVLSIAFIYNNKTSEIFIEDGVIYAVTVDGETSTTFPKKGVYDVNVSCQKGNGKWDYINWKLLIEDITGDVSCEISFTSKDANYLNSHIMSLAGTAQGNGQVVNEKGYRYEGKNPSNYIWFNNELWRIIGVFDAETHGQTDLNLVKIIRADSIGMLSWNKSYSYTWSNSALNNLLNGAYYNRQNGNTTDYCYGNSSTLKSNCDYREIGINNESRKLIKEVVWKLGGNSAFTATAEAMYGYERGTAVYSSYPRSITAYVGLMYPSDYAYAVLGTYCERTTTLANYGNSNCSGKSWLYNGGYEWTLTHISNSNGSVYQITNSGTFSFINENQGSMVRPVVYLNENVYIASGDGSIENPYIIG